MTYSRRVVLETALVRWHEATLVEAAPGWSESYRVDRPTLVVPVTGGFACELAGRRWQCDTATAVWLDPGSSYRMRRPWTDQRSTVIALHDFHAPASRRALDTRAHLHLRGLRRGLLAGHCETLDAEERLASWVRGMLHGGGEPHLSHPAVERAREFLDAHYREDARLDAIARAVACSPFHLARMFRRHTGRSLHAYRTQLRLAEALRRIDEGQRDLLALALDLGFTSHSHFTATFGKMLGVTPAQVRTNLITAAAPR